MGLRDMMKDDRAPVFLNTDGFAESGVTYTSVTGTTYSSLKVLAHEFQFNPEQEQDAGRRQMEYVRWIEVGVADVPNSYRGDKIALADGTWTVHRIDSDNGVMRRLMTVLVKSAEWGGRKLNNADFDRYSR